MNLEDEIEEEEAQLGIMLEVATVKNASLERENARLTEELKRSKKREDNLVSAFETMRHAAETANSKCSRLAARVAELETAIKNMRDDKQEGK